jgi:outer membrane murein-binding lipoprotein Lpp
VKLEAKISELQNALEEMRKLAYRAVEESAVAKQKAEEATKSASGCRCEIL